MSSPQPLSPSPWDFSATEIEGQVSTGCGERTQSIYSRIHQTYCCLGVYVFIFVLNTFSLFFVSLRLSPFTLSSCLALVHGSSAPCPLLMLAFSSSHFLHPASSLFLSFSGLVHSQAVFHGVAHLGTACVRYLLCGCDLATVRNGTGQIRLPLFIMIVSRQSQRNSEGHPMRQASEVTTKLAKRSSVIYEDREMEEDRRCRMVCRGEGRNYFASFPSPFHHSVCFVFASSRLTGPPSGDALTLLSCCCAPSHSSSSCLIITSLDG